VVPERSMMQREFQNGGSDDIRDPQTSALVGRHAGAIPTIQPHRSRQFTHGLSWQSLIQFFAAKWKTTLPWVSKL